MVEFFIGVFGFALGYAWKWMVVDMKENPPPGDIL